MLAYIGVIERKNSVTIDGYTSAKTVKGILKDISRAVEKYDKGEAECLASFSKEYDEEFNNPFIDPSHSDGGYFLTYEEVPCASQWDEEKEEMKYRAGFHHYFCIRIMK